MIIAQTLLLIAVGWGVFTWSRAVSSRVTPFVAAVIGAGFVVRIFGGLASYHISYWHLPILRSLQASGGRWFYSLDASLYDWSATSLAESGLAAIFSAENWFPSIFYVRLLAVAHWLIGAGFPVAILLNGVFWLASASLIVFWRGRSTADSPGARIALIAVGLSPAMILWSTQPLKDPLFVLLLITGVWAMDRIGKAWEDGHKPFMESLLGVAAFLASFMAAVGVRWYFGTFLAGGILFYSACQFFRLPSSRRAGFSITVLVILVVSLGLGPFAAGAGAVKEAKRLLTPGFSEGQLSTVRYLESSRRGFEAARANTQIRPGPIAEMLDPFDGRRSGQTGPDSPEGRKEIIGRGEVSRHMGFMAGAIAMVVPRAIAQTLGILDVSGGRGMWLFADIDTMWFDFVLFAAGVAVWRTRHRKSWKDPLVLTLAFLFVAVGGPLAYVITNFGTLVRHRNMVMIFAALIPVAINLIRDAASVDPESPEPSEISSEYRVDG